MTMAKFDLSGFLRDCYLHAEPKIDIKKAKEIVASAHKIKLSVYNNLLKKWELTDENGNAKDEDLLFGVQFYCMDKGPTWVDDLTPKAA